MQQQDGLTQFDKEIMEEWASQRDQNIQNAPKVDIDTKNTADVGDKEMIEVLKKAQKIQREKNILKRSVDDDFGKGNVRNQPCPVCGVKLKKCTCGFLEKNLK